MNPTASNPVRSILCALVLAIWPHAQSVAQQQYPQKPVRIVVPYPAGGAMDVATRVLLEGMAPRFGKPLIVENRPGASGNIGTEQVARADADGHTLLLGIAANTAINKYLYPKLPFDLDRDLVPVAQFGVSTNVIYVHRSFPAANLDELLARLREQPGRHSYATPGSGTTPHLSMELIKSRTRTYVVHIPYKGSTAAVAGVLGGDLPIGVDAVIAAAPHIRAGALKAIAVTGMERSSVLPEVPTLREAGLGIDASTYLGIFAPAKTAAPVLSRLEAEIGAATRVADVSERLRNAGIEPEFRGASEFALRVKRDRELWQEAVRHSGASTY